MRQVIIYKNYFLDFYNKQTAKVQSKIEWTLGIIEEVDRIPTKFFQYLTGTDGLYEIRIEFEGNIYRIFSFFDRGNIVVLVNSFQKKSQKTPKKEINKALRIKKEYFNEKEHKNI